MPIPALSEAATAIKVSSKNKIDAGTPLKISFEIGFSISSWSGKSIFMRFPGYAKVKAASAELKISV